MATPFFGMRGTGDWVTNEDPQNWRQKILELYPNGHAPLVAITSMTGRGESIKSTQHNWWTRTMSTQAGAVTSVYIDSALGTEYVYASHAATFGAAGGVVYAKVAEATADMFREGHQVLLRDSDQYTVDVVGKCVDVVLNGASSYIAVKLIEADDNGGATYNLATVDRILVVGNVNSQGATRPEAITYDPAQVYNLTQIWRTPNDLTRTAMYTELRSRDAYLDTKQQSLLYHGIEMEKSLIWGVRSAGTGANGKPENTIMGIVQFINTYASANCDSFKTNTTYSGQTWLEGGKTWLDSMMKAIFSQGRGSLGGDAIVFCGAGAMLGIQRLVESSAMYQIKEGEAGYGISVQRFHNVFGTFSLKIHPLFSWETTNDYSMLVIPPAHIKWLPLQKSDTHYKKDTSWKEGGGTGKDGLEEEWLTEGTYEFQLDGPWGYLNGVGEDNAV